MMSAGDVGLRRDDAGQRREEDREQEQDAGDDRRRSRSGRPRRRQPRSRCRWCSRLTPATPPAIGREAVDEEDPADARARAPSSLARPASEATPVTVPIVSKKSVSMIAKIVRAAASGPSTVKTLVRSKWPIGREARRHREGRRDAWRRPGGARRW